METGSSFAQSHHIIGQFAIVHDTRTAAGGRQVSKDVIDVNGSGQAEGSQVDQFFFYNEPALTMPMSLLRQMALTRGTEVIREGDPMAGLVNVHQTGVPVAENARVIDSNRRTLTDLKLSLGYPPSARWAIDTTPGKEALLLFQPQMIA